MANEPIRDLPHRIQVSDGLDGMGMVTLDVETFRDLNYWAAVGRAYCERDMYMMRGGKLH